MTEWAARVTRASVALGYSGGILLEVRFFRVRCGIHVIWSESHDPPSREDDASIGDTRRINP